MLIDEACARGARLGPCCDVVGLDVRTVQRWRRRGVCEDMRMGPKTKPVNSLTEAEETEVLRVVNSKEFRDLSPKQIVPILADRRQYLASEATIERLLHREGQRKHRGPKRCRSVTKPKEKLATASCQIWTWDITCLPSPVVGHFFYLYMAIDIWSRKIVGAKVFDRECSELAKEWLVNAMAGEEIEAKSLTVHSDNGAPMKGILKACLENLGVFMSYSRPHVSDDNPYSESLFSTMKTRPHYPRNGFKDLEAAQTWCSLFVAWYNDEHRHSSIGYVTPNQRHNGAADAILAQRRNVYEQARQKHPERWSGKPRSWTPAEKVYLNPDQHTLELQRRK